MAPESAHLSTLMTWVQAMIQVGLGSGRFVLYRASLPRNEVTRHGGTPAKVWGGLPTPGSKTGRGVDKSQTDSRGGREETGKQ